MQIETLRFGEVEIDENKIISFRDGIPGLEESKKFALMNFEDSGPILWLQSVDQKEICLPVIDSFSVLPDYAFDISDEDVDELELKTPADLHVLTIVVIPDSIEGMTANLAAPIIINIKTRNAKQIILSGGEFNVRYPVFSEVVALARKEDSDAGSV